MFLCKPSKMTLLLVLCIFSVQLVTRANETAPPTTIRPVESSTPHETAPHSSHTANQHCSQDFLKKVKDTNKELFKEADQNYVIINSVRHRHRDIILSSCPGTRQHVLHYKLRLEKAKYLISPRIKVTKYLLKSTVISSDVTNCYYHGRVKKVRDSFAALSNCSGLSGVIYIEGTTYLIRPLELSAQNNITAQDHQLHILYKVRPSERTFCGNVGGRWMSYKELHKGEYLRKMKWARANINTMDSQIELKYLEIAIILDYTMVSKLGKRDAIQYAIEAANIMDLFYKHLNVRIVVSYVEIWADSDKIMVTSNTRQTLQQFASYRKHLLQDVSHDSTHFISGRTFNTNSGGMSIPDSVCTDRAVSLSQGGHIENIYEHGIVMAHMAGHNLGLVHDEEKDKCLCHDSNGCTMGQILTGHGAGYPKTFSLCSRNDLDASLHTGLAYCLYNEPKQPSFTQYCGNSITERGEECDCGSREDCDKHDPCCDPSTCMLKHWASCRSGPCCHNCTAHGKEHMCREASNTECDVPEFCDGLSSQCPSDNFVQDGTPCGQEHGYCYNGICPTHDKHCRHIWGPASSKADLKCFQTFNTKGNIHGHCGEGVQGKHRTCNTWDVLCGLVHCQHGEKSPIITGRIFHSVTSLPESTAQCKIVTGPQKYDNIDIGLSPEGSKCGNGKMCIHQQCVDIKSQIMVVSCEQGLNNLPCSGNGVCTSHLTCYCDYGYTGRNCSIQLDVPPKTTQELSTPSTTVSDTTLSLNSSLLLKKSTSEAEGVDTVMIVVILGSSVGGLILIFTLVMCCYRRRSPSHIKGPYKNGTILSSSMLSRRAASVKSISSAEDKPGRVIQFGSMPSYRKDKLLDKTGKKKIKRQKTESDVTDSEGTPTSSDETQVKVVPNDLSRVPERSILKTTPRTTRHIKVLPNVVISSDRNCSSSDDHKKEFSPSDNEHYITCDPTVYSPKRGNKDSMQRSREISESPPPLKKPPYIPSDASKDSLALDTPVNHLDFCDSQLTLKDNDNSSSNTSNTSNSLSSSLEDILPKVPSSINNIDPETASNLSTPRDVKESPNKSLDLPQSANLNICHVQSSNKDVSLLQRQGAKLIKPTNIDDLLKSIDKQAQEALSPTNSHNSDENSQRYSEPEVDHHYKHNDKSPATDIAKRPKTLHLQLNKNQRRHTPPKNIKNAMQQSKTDKKALTNCHDASDSLASDSLACDRSPFLRVSPGHRLVPLRHVSPTHRTVPVTTIIGPVSKSAGSSPSKDVPLSIFQPISHPTSSSPPASSSQSRSRSRHDPSPAYSDMVVYSPPSSNLFRPIHPAKISYEDFEQELALCGDKRLSKGQGHHSKGHRSHGSHRRRKESY